MEERDIIFLQLTFKKCFKHSGRFQEAWWISNQQVFDEVPSSFLWCLSLYQKRRQSPFVFTTAQWRQCRREILIKKRLQYKHFPSSLICNGTSAKLHITVIPFKAQQLSLVPLKQLIYLTGLLTGDSPSLLLSASLNFCNSEMLLDAAGSLYDTLCNQPYVLYGFRPQGKSLHNKSAVEKVFRSLT